jgi:hypothetical protein
MRPSTLGDFIRYIDQLEQSRAVANDQLTQRSLERC